jgi:RNA polymerase sigma factor (sigma-70 family)
MPVAESMHTAIRHFHQAERRRLYELLGDGELLSRFLRERDEAAFEEVVSRHGPMVRAVCRRMLGPTADADDAFQATFLILVRKANGIRRTNLLANWLCAVAYRTARQAARRRARLGLRERNTEQLPDPTATDEPPRDWLPLFDAALQKLPVKYREPVVLCELQGIARPVAARQLGLNEGTLSSRLGRARDLLRQKLIRHGFPLSIGAAVAPITVPESVTASTVAASLNVGAASVSAVVITEGVLTAMFASKIKAGMACAALLLAGVVASWQMLGTTTQAGGPPGKVDPPPRVLPEGAPAKPTTPGPISPLSKTPPLSADYVPFQGDWVVAGAQYNGSGQAGAIVGVDENWTFKGTVLATGGEAKEDSQEKFTLDTSATPSRIDFTLTSFSKDGTGTIVGTAYQGIYKFDLDGQLIICYRPKAERVLRPTRFATAQNSGATILILVRPQPPQPIAPGPEAFAPPGLPMRTGPDVSLPRVEVPPPAPSLTPPVIDPFSTPPPAPLSVAPPLPNFDLPIVDQKTPAPVPPDSERLQGVWVHTQQDGKPVTEQTQTLEFLKDRVLAGDGHGRFRVDESKSPKQLTITLTKRSETTIAIYTLENDRLTIASCGSSTKLIPTTFEPDPEAGISISVYERPRKDKPEMVRTEATIRDLPLATSNPVVGPDVGLAVNSRSFRLPYSVNKVLGIQILRLYRSDDRGKSWNEIEKTFAKEGQGHFDVTVPKIGVYWFAIQTEDSGRNRQPVDFSGFVPQVKVTVEAEGPTMRPPERDVSKELDQLREQVKRLENELKERKAVPPKGSN